MDLARDTSLSRFTFEIIILHLSAGLIEADLNRTLRLKSVVLR